MQHFIGIDVGSKACYAAVSTGVSPAQTGEPFPFDNTPDGINGLIACLVEQGCQPSTSIICMESCGVYAESLCYLLSIRGWRVAVEAPQKVARAMPVRSAKTDALDAGRIARFAARFLDELTIWNAPTETIEHGSTLLAVREGYAKQSVRLQNQLHSIRRKHLRNAYAEAILVADIAGVKGRIEELDKEIMRLINADASLKTMFAAIKSVPGVGPKVAAYLLIVTNCFANGFDAKRLAAHLGIAPLQYQSGTSVRRKTRSRGYGHRTLRKILCLGATSVAYHNAAMREYFQRLVAAGKNKRLVINNIENKIIALVCAVLKNGTKFDKNYRAVPAMNA